MSNLISGQLLGFSGSKLKFPKSSYCLGEWGHHTNEQQRNPDAVAVYGDREWALDWRPYLINMTPVQNETAKTPVAELKKNNWLRTKQDTYAPVVGITSAQSTCCNVQLYWNSAHTQPIDSSFYDTGTIFKPTQFWQYCKSNLATINSTYSTSYGCAIEVCLWDASGNKFQYGSPTNYHIVAPWETTEVNYSVFIGRPDDVYLIDGVVGDSGKKWKGVLSTPDIFDGIDASFYKLARTGISPMPVTAKYIDGRYRIRSFFYNYAAGNTFNASYDGTSDMSGMANGSNNYQDNDSSTSSGYNGGVFYNNGHYPIVSYNNNYINYGPEGRQAKVYARNCNYTKTSNAPVAEGGYHSLNTFLNCMEAAFGTRYLYSPTMFSSGISSNDTISNEADWKTKGGIKYVYGGNTYYHLWSTNCPYNSSTPWTCTMNRYKSKFQCCEPQIAMSLFVEMGLSEGSSFKWNGGTWRFEKPTAIDENLGINSLLDGEMNCRCYKEINFVPSSYTGYNVTLNLRCCLIEGVDCSGNIFAYYPGGAELVIDYIERGGNNISSFLNRINFWLQPDQTKWGYEDISNSQSNYWYKGYGDTFEFENTHKLVGYGYAVTGRVLNRLPYSPLGVDFATAINVSGGGYIQGKENVGESLVTYGQLLDYSTSGVQGYKTRRELSIRGSADYSFCSPRFLYAFDRLAHPWFTFGCAAQVLLQQ